jgi:hypothetical protein
VHHQEGLEEQRVERERRVRLRQAEQRRVEPAALEAVHEVGRAGFRHHRARVREGFAQGPQRVGRR